MKLVPNSLPEPSLTYYLPHHRVLKETRLTTKLRVVFNGSSKTISEISLNDFLSIGPILQNSLFDVRYGLDSFAIYFLQIVKRCFVK